MNILEHIVQVSKKAQAIAENRRILVLMLFGSHLYGTATENSDADYKGIFMPTESEVLTGKIPKHLKFETKENNTEKNTNEDMEIELYSLHYFLELAHKGETVAIDMLHCPEHFALITSREWQALRKNRAEFYTKNLKAFVGYCRKQAAKYGIKGSRLADAEKVINYLAATMPSGDFAKLRLKDVWDDLPQGEHIHKLPPDEKTPYRMYQVCGKKFLETVGVDDVWLILKKFYNEYGHRAQEAKENKGIDWKAVSHALRAANQLLQIYERNDILYPLVCARYLRDVKQGKLDYLSDVAPTLEALMIRVEELSEQSILPEKTNRKRWEKWLCETVKGALLT